MKTIQLLNPEYESRTGELQAFHSAKTVEAAGEFDANAESHGAICQGGDCEATPADGSLPIPVCFARTTGTSTRAWADRSLPSPVRFAWERVRDPSKTLVYDLVVSRDAEFKDPMVFKEIASPCSNVVNLHIGTRYYWKVVGHDRESVLAVSSVGTFKTHSSTPRWLQVPGISNVRDLGGWGLPGNQRIRQGLAYRSSEMNGHLDIADEGARVLIEDLKIRTDLDLRRSDESPRSALDPAMVKWVNIPVEPYSDIFKNENRIRYRKIFAIFADPSFYPILFHCYGGCDRGGTIAFLLQGLLGLDRDSMIRDYELSSLSIFGERSCSSGSPSSRGFQSLLAALQPFGDGEDGIGKQVENCILSIGVTSEEIASIRDHLTEKVGADDMRDAVSEERGD